MMSDIGHIGLALAMAEIGDLICALAGGRMPFVPRPSKPASTEVSTDRDFTSNGDAYIPRGDARRGDGSGEDREA